MQYSGGKAGVARELSETVKRLGAERRIYLEPFVGGGFMFAKTAPFFPAAVAADANPDLILLWRAVADGWVPPTEITPEEYRTLQHAAPSPLRTFAGFGMSFAGKWWGGYAKNSRGDNFAGAAARGIEMKRVAFEHAVDILCTDYRTLIPFATDQAVIYCDPPYADTLGYAGAPGQWDTEAWWDTAREWRSRGALVLVSEYSAPDDWTPCWSKDRRMSMRTSEGHQRTVTERLFL